MNNSAYSEARYIVEEASLMADPCGSPRKYLLALASAGLGYSGMRQAGSTFQVDIPGGVVLTADGGSVVVMTGEGTSTYRMTEEGWLDAIAQCVAYSDEALEVVQVLEDLQQALRGLYWEMGEPKELCDEMLLTAIGIASDIHGAEFSTLRRGAGVLIQFPLGVVGLAVTSGTVTLEVRSTSRTMMYDGDVESLAGWSAWRWIAEAIAA